MTTNKLQEVNTEGWRQLARSIAENRINIKRMLSYLDMSKGFYYRLSPEQRVEVQRDYLKSLEQDKS